jgi:hypothetical protein
MAKGAKRRLTPFHLIAVQNLVLVSCGVALPRFLKQRLTDWYLGT